LKNTHLLRCAHPSSLRRTITVRLIPLDFARLAFGCFEQPVKNHFFNNLMEKVFP
jgi:hypothetical protein